MQAVTPAGSVMRSLVSRGDGERFRINPGLELHALGLEVLFEDVHQFGAIR